MPVPRVCQKTVIAYDRALDAAAWQDFAPRVKIDSGCYVVAADRLETIRPGYAVVKMQQKHPRLTFAMKAARPRHLRPGRGGCRARPHQSRRRVARKRRHPLERLAAAPD